VGANGQAILALTGAAVGAYFGVPGIGFAVGSLIGGLLFEPDAEVATGPRLGDSQNQQSLYGIAIPVIYGQSRVAGNVFWGSEVEEFKKTTKSGGKGGQPKQETENFSYKWTGAIALCANEIAGIRRIWINDQFFTDITDPCGNAINMKIYQGTETQLPDPTMEAREGVGNVPGYRGLAYVVIKRFPLQGSSVPPTFHFEVIAKGSTDIVAQVVPDLPGEGPGEKIAFDPGSGLVWATKLTAVNVFSCEGSLARIKSFPHNAADGIRHQPGFVTQTKGSLGIGPGNITSIIKPKMWVAAASPDGLTNTLLVGYDVGGSFAPQVTISNPMGGSVFCWPGHLVIDRGLISDTLPPISGPVAGVVITTNGICGSGVAFNVSGIQPILSPSFIPGFQSYPTDSSDFPAGSNFGVIYIISQDGFIHRRIRVAPIPLSPFVFQANYIPIGVPHAAGNGFRITTNSLTVDPIAEQIYVTAWDQIANGYNVIKYTEHLEVVWSVLIPLVAGSFKPTVIRYHEEVGDVWMAGTQDGLIHLKRIDKSDGRIVDDLRVSNGVTTQVKDMLIFPGMQFAVANVNGSTMKIPLTPGAIPDSPFLSEIVTDLTLRTLELTAADIDVSSLTAIPVLGFVVGKRQSVRDVLQRLLENYFVDAVEMDGKVKFVQRGTLTNVTIPKSDLAAHSFGTESPSPILSQRTQENELPHSMDSRFIDVNNEYKISVVNSRRLAGNSQQIQGHDIPIVFTATNAKKVNDTLLFNLYADREPRDFIVSRKYLKITPSDVITLEDPDLGFIQLRINRVEYHFPQLLKMQGIPEDITLYSGFTFPAEETEAIQPVFPVPSRPILVILDIPQLRTKDRDPGVYVGAYTLSGAFSVAEVFRSINTTDFSPVATILDEVTVGQSQAAFGWDGDFK